MTQPTSSYPGPATDPPPPGLHHTQDTPHTLAQPTPTPPSHFAPSTPAPDLNTPQSPQPPTLPTLPIDRLAVSTTLLAPVAWGLLAQPALIATQRHADDLRQSDSSPHLSPASSLDVSPAAHAAHNRSSGLWLAADASLTIIAASWAVEQALTRCMTTPVLLTPVNPLNAHDEANSFEPIVTIGIRVGGPLPISPGDVQVPGKRGGTVLTFTLDAPAVRALTAGLSRRFSHATPEPIITPHPAAAASELALLDFLTLELLDSLGIPGLVHQYSTTSTATLPRPSRRVIFLMTCGGRSGRVAAYLPAGWEVAPTGEAWAAARGPAPLPPSHTAIGLSMPPMLMEWEELAAITPGDYVVTGVRRVTGALGCHLVNSHGWLLGDATAVVDSPTGVSFTAQWHERPVPACMPSAEDRDGLYAPCRVVLGLLTLPLNVIMSGPGSADVSIPLGPVPAWLLVGAQTVAWGELCLIDDEVALRILTTQR